MVLCYRHQSNGGNSILRLHISYSTLMDETICKGTVQNDRLADTNLVDAYLLSAERALEPFYF